ncbi:MAG: V-type ATP synthase subunit I [Candidatus Hydrogenedentota bacterium]|nr:MAG: V-type ATP synthase subunit I [Candidatus Hydrogenedentota bacterium]
MAVSKVRKLQLIAHAECREEVLATLRALASVHISDVKELFPESDGESPSFLKSSLSRVEEKLAQVLYCILFAERFISKPSFIQNLLMGRPVFTVQELEECVGNFDLEKFYEECTSIEKEIAETENRIEKKETFIADIAHWLRLESPLEAIEDTRATRVSLGICDARAFNPMTDELSETSALYHIEVVDRSRTSVSMMLIYPKSVEESVSPILRKHGWRTVKFEESTGTPAEAVAELREEIRELQERNRQLREHVTNELLPSLDKLLLLHDHYSQELHALEIQHSFLFTSHTFLINGWIVAKQERTLRRRLNDVTQGFELRCSDPEPDDRVPILLENRPLVKPFSLITELYGQPQYTEFDPTPLLFPFFVLFFGVCLGEAGYGLVLAIGSYIILKKFEIQEGPRKLLQILVWGGLSSVVVGLFTGGIFAIDLAKLPAVFGEIQLLDPTTQVLAFLYISFLLGLVQIMFGLGVKMVHNFREGDIIGGIFERAFWIILLVAMAPILYKGLFAGAVSEPLISAGRTVALIVIVPLILARGRGIKKVLLVPLMGLLQTARDALGFFGDILSYARLMALGLSTTFLAITINDIAELILDIPFGIGYVFAALVLVFGHAFNLVINCLSAFVHTLRLQYLEFFPKFFVGGGEPFSPFAEERKYTIVQPRLEHALSKSSR